MALRDIGRVIGLPYGRVLIQLSKMIPFDPSRPLTLARICCHREPRLQEAAKRRFQRIEKLIEFSLEVRRFV